jgi:hypothetical protein
MSLFFGSQRVYTSEKGEIDDKTIGGSFTRFSADLPLSG